MEERQTSGLIALLLAGMKALPLTAEYVKESDGSISGWTEEITCHANAPDYETCRAEMVKMLRGVAHSWCEDIDDWLSHNPSELPYIMKICLSTDEELKQCLAGQN
ncbi:MAG: hypothetical protein IJP89_06630 [Synergistaceae bacterium]|nr:hypothetical protein [Synergistaceae bacterium]